MFFIVQEKENLVKKNEKLRKKFPKTIYQFGKVHFGNQNCFIDKIPE